jgi:glycosyltransferase involved in cell wall biosynthesis
MSSPLVSIVIPCYNAERYVAEAIRSGLEQTYTPVEVIVVDDGSTDKSLSVIQGFGDAVRSISVPNAGGCAARNRGLRMAQGEFIQFLDADDWLYPQKIERQMAAWKAQPDATPICDWDVINVTTGMTQRNTCPESCDDSLRTLLEHSLPTQSPLHRREALNRVGGFLEGLPCSQERDLHLRLASYGWKLKRIPEPLFAVRRLEGSVSSSFERVLDQHLALAGRVREILFQQGTWTDENSCALATFLARDGRHYAKLQCWEKAQACFAAAKEMHSSGGIAAAFGASARWLARSIGPIPTERLLSIVRPLISWGTSSPA